MNRLRRLLPNSIAARIVAASAAVAVVAIAIVGVGVWLVGGETFTKLMTTHGEEAAEAHAMFDESVTSILLIAVAVAVAAAALMSIVLGEWLARPLREARRAAGRVAEGDYETRMARHGSSELVGLADSFNQMAEALSEHERNQRDFMLNAAHELATPLTNLQGYLEALRDGVIKPEPQVFDALRGEVDRLSRLSSSLNQLGHDAHDSPSGAAGAQGRVDVAALVGNVIELARPAAAARELELTAETQPLMVAADADRLTQVVTNLLNNAIDFTPRGGQITVCAERRNDDVLVSVLNTGDGIPATDLPHIFERFYRVEKSRDRRRGGAGLGLAIVRQLVESAGGRVGAESSDGRTRIWFTVKPA